MPYIKQEDRLQYESEINALVDKIIYVGRENTTSVYPGHFNYIISTLIKRSYEGVSLADNFKLGYSDYNEIVGMLECAKQEFIRRILNPYEDKKIEENGDI